MNQGSHTLGVYDATTGAAVNTAFITGLNSPTGIAVVSAVPEPEAYAMLLAGLGLVGAVVRRRRSIDTSGVTPCQL